VKERFARVFEPKMLKKNISENETFLDLSLPSPIPSIVAIPENGFPSQTDPLFLY